MEKMKRSRAVSFLVILVVYVLATFAGVAVYDMLPATMNEILRLFIADTAATVLVWIFSMAYRNSSIYDPYWSVAPIVILSLLAWHYGACDIPSLLMLAGVWVWGVRLTVNWAVTFENLTIQDWRYDDLKRSSGKAWPIASFFSVHYIPTLVVFGAMLPAFKLLTLDAVANVFTYIAFAVTIVAAGLQFFADRQAHAFRRANPGKVCNVGLWKYSRHPNYLGEVMMWWGVYFILLSVDTGLWWTGVGAVINTCLFLFISIPMMEKRQLANKPAYADYVKTTSMLLLLPPRCK